MVELTDRNKKIYKEKEAGRTYRDLAIEYGLSQNRVQEIVNREKYRKVFKNIKQ